MGRIIQESHCAFSKACVNTNSPHVRVAGTNKVMCCSHAAALTVATPANVNGTEFSTSSFNGPRSSNRRGSWATYVGVSGVY